MDKFSDLVVIIGAGISGLSLGITLAKKNIRSIIFEKHNDIHGLGAGISISPNGINVLNELDVTKSLISISSNPKKVKLHSGDQIIKTLSADVITTSRKSLYKVLYEKYSELGGEIIFNREVKDINYNENLIYTDEDTLQAKIICACNGIKSKIRDKFDKSTPEYSGYSVFRSILNKSQKNIEFYLAPGFHVVAYPVNENQTSFVAAYKSKNKVIESWRKKSNIKELEKIVHKKIIERFYNLKKSDIYKWGVYLRPNITNLSYKNTFLLGDAAHPIVPFMGQGGCLALEDGYILGTLIDRYRNNIEKVSYFYNKSRIPRVKFVDKVSHMQGKLNHLENPHLINIRNFLLKNTNIAGYRNKIWDFNVNTDVNKYL